MSDRAGWKNYRLSEIAELNPRRPSSLQSLDQETPVTFVPMASVCEHEGIIKEPIIRPYVEVRKGFTWFTDQDVIFAKITPCMQNGKSAVARGLTNGIGFGSTEFHVIRPSPLVLPEWIYHFVRQQPFRAEAAKNFRGSAGQQRVPEDFLAKQTVPVPDLETQRRIVARIQDCFSRLEEMEQLHQSVKRDTTTLLSATLRQCFEAFADAPQSSLEEVTLESKYGTNAKCHEHLQGIPILRIPNVAQGVISLEKLKFTKLPLKELEKVRLKSGDLLIVRTNGSPELVGRCAVFDQPGDYGYASYLIRFRLDTKRVRPHFVSLYLQSPQGREAISKIRQTSAGQFNINSENLRAVTLPLPLLVEQDQVIGLALRTQEAAKEIGSENISNTSDLSHLRTAILREAFAGRL